MRKDHLEQAGGQSNQNKNSAAEKRAKGGQQNQTFQASTAFHGEKGTKFVEAP